MPRPATGQVLERDGAKGTTYALRFRAYGQRQYVTLGTDAEGWTNKKAEDELANVLADVRRGIWRPPAVEVVAAPQEEPTFHVYASEWFANRKTRGLGDRTIDYSEWALTNHLLGFFGPYRPSQITRKLIDGYTRSKVSERERLVFELSEWEATEPSRRGPKPERPLSNASINKTVGVLAQILDDAVEDDDVKISENPARGKKRKLKVKRPYRIWLEYDEIRSLLDAAGRHRALVATMILTGLRVSELCALRWRSIDLAAGKLTVEDSKTEAGEWRTIDLTPLLLEALKLHSAANRGAGADDLVFPTLTGTQRDRQNVRSRVLLPALDRANKKRAEAGLSEIAHVTNHTLRRTFASVLYDAGASPADVMAQMGHKSAALALEVYARKMKRSSETAKRMDENLDWAQSGTSDDAVAFTLPAEETAGGVTPLN